MKMHQITILLAFSLLLAGSRLAAQMTETELHSSAIVQSLAKSDSASFNSFVKQQAVADTVLWKYYQRTSSQFLSFQRAMRKSDNPMQLKMIDVLEKQIEQDFMGSKIKARQMDQFSLLNLSGLAQYGISKYQQSKAKPKSIAELPLPTQLELKLLALLWEKAESSDLELYAKLDSTQHLTFEMLRKELDNMRKKGFLAKRITSPQYPFDFITPFGTVRFEMSAKNRNNREFAYTPLVDREKLFEYLNGQYYLASLGESSGGKAENLRTLLQELLLASEKAQ